MLNSKSLMSLGAALASIPAARAITSSTMSDALGLIGLERRRSHLLDAVMLVGVGACVGAGLGVLFAPASGEVTRRRLSEGAKRMVKDAEELGNKTIERLSERVEEVADNARAKTQVGSHVSPH